MLCDKCDNESSHGSVISIQGSQSFICSECDKSRVGITALCDKCHKIDIIVYQDEVFRNTECQACYDKHFEYIQKAIDVYKKYEEKNKNEAI